MPQGYDALRTAQTDANKNKKIAVAATAALCAVVLVFAVVVVILLSGKDEPETQNPAVVEGDNIQQTAPSASDGENIVDEAVADDGADEAFEKDDNGGSAPVEENAPSGSVTFSVGDYIRIGNYEQDNDLSNGKESIEWVVLEEEGDKVLVVSRYALDGREYHNADTEDVVTWENSDIRKWLNEDFFNEAFSETEKNLIPEMPVEVENCPNNGVGTNDKIFLLSEAEVRRYFGRMKEQVCEATDYADSKGVFRNEKGACRWWVRTMSTGYRGQGARHINIVGGALSAEVSANYAVRPAMWMIVE